MTGGYSPTRRWLRGENAARFRHYVGAMTWIFSIGGDGWKTSPAVQESLRSLEPAAMSLSIRMQRRLGVVSLPFWLARALGALEVQIWGS
jgi:hypothetical protein